MDCGRAVEYLVGSGVVSVCIAVAFKTQLLGSMKRPSAAISCHVPVEQRMEVLRLVVGQRSIGPRRARKIIQMVQESGHAPQPSTH